MRASRLTLVASLFGFACMDRSPFQSPTGAICTGSSVKSPMEKILVAGDWIYFGHIAAMGSNRSLSRIKKDGSQNGSDLITDISSGDDLVEILAVEDQVFYVSRAGASDRGKAAWHDRRRGGQEVMPLTTGMTGQVGACGIAFDPVDRFIYWSGAADSADSFAIYRRPIPTEPCDETTCPPAETFVNAYTFTHHPERFNNVCRIAVGDQNFYWFEPDADPRYADDPSGPSNWVLCKAPTTGAAPQSCSAVASFSSLMSPDQFGTAMAGLTVVDNKAYFGTISGDPNGVVVVDTAANSEPVSLIDNANPSEILVDDTHVYWRVLYNDNPATLLTARTIQLGSATLDGKSQHNLQSGSVYSVAMDEDHVYSGSGDCVYIFEK
jgi:hypothetical protein